MTQPMGAEPSSKRHATMSRRTLLAAGGAAAAAAAIAPPAFRTALSIAAAPAAAAGAQPFVHRGYYLTFMRMPTYGLPAWKQTIDAFAGDDIRFADAVTAKQKSRRSSRRLFDE